MSRRGDESTELAVWQIVNIWEASSAFEGLIYHPSIVKGISQLTDAPNLMVWHDQIQYKPPNHGGATRWHQDAPLWPIILPMTPVSAWIALDDADEDNGCMWMVPGSYKWGDQMEFLRTQQHLEQREEFMNFKGFLHPMIQKSKLSNRSRPVKSVRSSFHHSLTCTVRHSTLRSTTTGYRHHYMTGESRFCGKWSAFNEAVCNVWKMGNLWLKPANTSLLSVEKVQPIGVPA